MINHPTITHSRPSMPATTGMSGFCETPLALRPPLLFKAYERKAASGFVENFKYVAHVLMGRDDFDTFMPPKRQKWDPEAINIKIRNTIGWDEIGDDHKYKMVVGRRQLSKDPQSMEQEAQYYCQQMGIFRYREKETGYHCRDCDSRDPGKFVEDHAHGDVVCTVCGLVVVERKIDEGDPHRHFEDDKEDTRHYGMVGNPLLSEATNLRTTIAATGDKERSGYKHISRKIDSRDTWSDYGGSTHQAYRDDMIIRAMDTVTKLSELSDITIQRGLENFAKFRNYREHVHKFNRSLMCCIAIALYDTYVEQKRFEDEVIATQKPWPCESCGLEYATRRDVEKHRRDCAMIPRRKRLESERKRKEAQARQERNWEITVKRTNYIDFSDVKPKRRKKDRKPMLMGK